MVMMMMMIVVAVGNKVEPGRGWTWDSRCSAAHAIGQKEKI